MSSLKLLLQLPGYVVNFRPSPLGCWLPSDHPNYNDANCGGPTIPLPAGVQDIVPFSAIAATSRGGYTFGSPIPRFPRTTLKPSSSPTSPSPRSSSPILSPPANPSSPSTNPSVPPPRKICQYSGYCRSSADCILGNKCSISNPYYSQCVPDAIT